MSTSGQISGTPTTMGSYSFQVQVTDSTSKSSSTNFSMKVTGPAPSLTGITPTSGSTSGGTSVTISGKNLQSGATVTFGGVAGTSVNVSSSTQMTAVTPAHAAGSVDVTVTNPGGKSGTLAAAFSYGSAPPSVSAISPNGGPTSGGTAVTITGANFLSGAAVLFGTAQASSVAVTGATQIQAVSPSGSGSVNVIVKNPDGQTGTLSGGFSYTSAATGAPTISSLSPNSGPDGTNTVINGSNFVSGATVSFGGTAASSVQFVNTNQISAVVPSISTGSYDVTVNNPGGATATLASGYTVTSPQSLLSGCTVGANNQPSCAIPSGWTLVQADGFDTGSLANSTNESLHGTSIECTFAHTGSCAEAAPYSSDGQSFRWILNPGVIGSSDEVYVSWWEYLDPAARLNAEMFLASAIQNTGTNPQYDILDWWASPNNCANGQGPGPSYNCGNAQIVMTQQANSSNGVNNSSYANFLDANLGAWRQYEWHFKANTPGSSDGVAELYVNGQLFASWTNMNWNGSLDMSGMEIDVGGTYTSGAWTDSTGATCEVYASTGTMHWCSPFSACTPCPIPPDFNRYWDDIIVLKK